MQRGCPFPRVAVFRFRRSGAHRPDHLNNPSSTMSTRSTRGHCMAAPVLVPWLAGCRRMGLVARTAERWLRSNDARLPRPIWLGSQRFFLEADVVRVEAARVIGGDDREAAFATAFSVALGRQIAA